MRRAIKRAPKSLKARVGPWKSSSMWSAGESETSFTGKLIASATICQSTSSGTSGVANGFTTRKQTSVKGRRRNSSSSSAVCRAISAGMYKPPSGARPRKTAPRKEVSGVLSAVLRYLTGNAPCVQTCQCVATASALFPGMPYLRIQRLSLREGKARAIPQQGSSNAPGRRSFGGGQQSARDSSAPRCRAALPLCGPEKLRARAPAWDLPDSDVLGVPAHQEKPPNEPPASACAAGAAGDCPRRSRCRSCPESDLARDFFRGRRGLHRAWKFPRPDRRLRVAHTWRCLANPSTRLRHGYRHNLPIAEGRTVAVRFPYHRRQRGSLQRRCVVSNRIFPSRTCRPGRGATAAGNKAT